MTAAQAFGFLLAAFLFADGHVVAGIIVIMLVT